MIPLFLSDSTLTSGITMDFTSELQRQVEKARRSRVTAPRVAPGELDEGQCTWLFKRASLKNNI